MNEFIKKSENNIKTAQFLIENCSDGSYLASSVHCSYYGFYQALLHIQHNIDGINDQGNTYKRAFNSPQNQECKDLVRIIEKKSQIIGSTHKNTAFYYMIKLYSEHGEDIAYEYWTKYHELSMNRNSADYKTDVIEKRKAQNANKISQELIIILKENFNV